MCVSPEKLFQISSSFFFCEIESGMDAPWIKSLGSGVSSRAGINPLALSLPPRLCKCSVKYVSTKRRNPLCTDSKWGLKSLSAKTRRLVWQSNETSLIPWAEFSTLICYIFLVLHSFRWAATAQDCASRSLKWEKSTVLIFSSWDGCFLSADCSYKWKQINRAISDWPP